MRSDGKKNQPWTGSKCTGWQRKLMTARYITEGFFPLRTTGHRHHIQPGLPAARSRKEGTAGLGGGGRRSLDGFALLPVRNRSRAGASELVTGSISILGEGGL